MDFCGLSSVVCRQFLSLFKKFTSILCVFLYNITIIESPTLTSAAATIIIKKTKICASLANVGNAFAAELAACMFENATNNKFTAFNINSTHIKTIMALRRVNTPTIPILNNVNDNAM
jgi:hypothetical protein